MPFIPGFQDPGADALGRIRNEAPALARLHSAMNYERLDEDPFAKLMRMLMETAQRPEYEYQDLQGGTGFGGRHRVLKPYQQQALQQLMAIQQFRNEQEQKKEQTKLQHEDIAAKLEAAKVKAQAKASRPADTTRLKKLASYVGSENRNISDKIKSFSSQLGFATPDTAKQLQDQIKTLLDQQKELQKIQYAIVSGDPNADQYFRDYVMKYYPGAVPKETQQPVIPPTAQATQAAPQPNVASDALSYVLGGE